MLTEDDKEKFKATCAMLIFIHYALDHPLYTYALYSPRTKKVFFRQDVIFLPEVFPMREARTRMGLLPDGEILTYRVQQMEGEEAFGQWKESDPLPAYQDHITGFSIVSPVDSTSQSTPERSKDWPRTKPSHPAFGVPSVVEVLKPVWTCTKDGEFNDGIELIQRGIEDGDEGNENGENEPKGERPRRMGGKPQPLARPSTRRPVKDRWYYEASGTALVTQQGQQNHGENDKGDDEDDKRKRDVDDNEGEDDKDQKCREGKSGRTISTRPC
jgi:hypothetical protein